MLTLKLGDPPNDKKRHDKMIDLTMQLNTNGPKNAIEIMQIAKVGKDIVKYACAIYIVVNYGPHDIINYIKNYQLVIPFETGVERIKRRFIKPIAGECEIFCSDLKIEFKCNFT